jgi:hypothetical protein
VGVVSTVAGVPGLAGFGDGPALDATFDRPTWIDVARIAGLVVKPGDIFVVDRVNQSIRLISANGVSTYRVSRPPEPVTFDFGGPFGGGIVVEPPDSGCGASSYDSGMFVASSGAHQIALVSMVGLLGNRDGSQLIGVANAPGATDGSEFIAQFRIPTGLTLSWDYAGDRPGLLQPFPFQQRRLYVADTGNHTIRQIRFSSSAEFCPEARIIETIAGAAGEAGSTDGVGTAARFNSPRGLASGPDGSVYIADSGNHAIRRIAPGGTVTTIAGELGVPGSDDGVARGAHLNTPSGIDVNAKGEIFIADTGNHAIRLITTDGRLVTIAGTSGVPGFADGYATSAKFAGPVGLRIAPDGSLLIADTSNNVIRRYSVVSTPQNRRRSVRH